MTIDASKYPLEHIRKTLARWYEESWSPTGAVIGHSWDKAVLVQVMEILEQMETAA